MKALENMDKVDGYVMQSKGTFHLLMNNRSIFCIVRWLLTSRRRAFARNVEVSFRIFQVIASPKVIASCYPRLPTLPPIAQVLQLFTCSRKRILSLLFLPLHTS